MTDGDATTRSSSSSHRLPTVSASQALQTLHARGTRVLSTGLSQLNKILTPQGLPGRNLDGGLLRGKVTEVYGPSGVGKTAFGIQAAVIALSEGHGIIWLDAGAPLVSQRVDDALSAQRQRQQQADPATGVASPPKVSRDELQSRFYHRAVPCLAHLLALFGRPPSSFPPPNTSLIVIDSLSTLFDNTYPRNADDRTSRNKSGQTRWAAGRKFPVMNELISSLSRMAALHDIAILLTCQTITRMRGGSRALLVPAISGADWENGISTRLVLFRDWIPGQGKCHDADAEKSQRVRFVGVVKANGMALADEGGVGNVIPFTIDRVGLRDVHIATVDIAAPTLPTQQVRPPKRHFSEIADSEDEEPDSDELYGWVEDDEVAAEGLLVDDAATPDNANLTDAGAHAESRADHISGKEEKTAQKRTATV